MRFDLELKVRRPPFELEAKLAGECRVLGIFGPSGSGKTTLLNCIAGVARPDSGRVIVDGETLFDSQMGVNLPIHRRRIGYVFQDSLLFPHMTVRQNLLYGCKGSSESPGLQDVSAALELTRFLDRRPAELSGGEQRRVSIGRAVMSGPKLLLFDEPLTGLDVELASRVLANLRRVLDRFSIPAIYVSHTVSDLLFLCDEVAAFRNGKVVARGPTGDVLMKGGLLAPSHWAELRNIFRGRITKRETSHGESTAQCRVGDTDLTIFAGDAVDDEAVVSVHAADLVIARDKPGALSARNVFPATIRSIVESGQKRLVIADAGAPWMVEISDAAIRELGLAPGVTVYLILKTSSIRVG